MTKNPLDKPIIALVTGANKGIGRSIAEQLGETGMTVLLGSRDHDRGATAEAELRAKGIDAHAVDLDVTKADSIRAAAKAIGDQFGRLDVLVNNAGVSGPSPRLAPSSADLDLVREVFEVNFFGVLAVTQAMLPLLRHSSAGRIVNISSEVGSLHAMSDPGHYMSKLPAQAAYPTSKTALNSLTVQFAKELRGENILVNAVTPGACATDFTKGLNIDIPRTAADGAKIAVKLATVGPDGPTGGFFGDSGPVAW